MNAILSKVQTAWNKPVGKKGVVFYWLMSLLMVGQILFLTWGLAAYGKTPEHSMIFTTALGIVAYAAAAGGLLFMLKILTLPRN